MMNHVWWRTHLRKLSEIGFVERLTDFSEVDEYMPFLTGALDTPAGGRVLEVGCGLGSFSVRLAQWGYRVTATEYSVALLELAEQAARQHGVQIDYRRGQPESLLERSVFDGALLLDYGCGSDAENAAAIRAVAAALKPGARVVFGTCNPYYWSRDSRTVHLVLNRTDIIRRYTFDFLTGSVVSRLRFILPTGERKAVPEARYRAYTPPELRSLTAAVGLADLRIHGEDDAGAPRPDRPLDSLRTPYFHCVALRPVSGEGGEGI